MTRRQVDAKENSDAGLPWRDPWEPRIIDILRRVQLLEYASQDQRDELRVEIGGILEAWATREKVSELREMLGLGRTRQGRKRKNATVLREYAFVVHYLFLERRVGDKAAMQQALQDAKNEKGKELDVKSAENWIAEWRPLIEPLLVGVAEAK